MLESEKILPICPEQLGGLPTPRAPSCGVDKKYLTGVMAALFIRKGYIVEEEVIT